MRSRQKVKAVWDSDLETLLGSLDILDSLIARELACKICGRSIDIDNLGSVFSDDQGLQVTCDDMICVRAVTLGEPTLAGE